MSGRTVVRALGDRALLVETADVRAAHSLAAALSAHAGAGTAAGVIEEIVVGFASVLVVLDDDPDRADIGRMTAWLAEAARTPTPADTPGGPTRDHVLSVVFDGDDLAEVATAIGVGVDDVVDLVLGATFDVAFVGFAPGFPYLTGLPPALAALPRRSTPRTAVPAGSLAVAGGFAGIYPQSTPGGWHLLGRTTERLFDPDVVPPGRLRPGDRVRITRAASDAPDAPGPHVPRLRSPAAGGPHLEVLDPGLATTVQDRGRRGVAHLGVPHAGAADPRSARLVNLLLGDSPDSAVLECTATGPTLRVRGGGHLAVVGVGPVDVTVDGHQVPDGTVLPVVDGQVVRIGRIHDGLRAYVGTAGGLTTPQLFGSRSTDTLSGLGSAPLQVGDLLPRGTPGRVRGTLDVAGRTGHRPAVLRVVPGPDGPAEELVDDSWRVGAAADRIGVRLERGRGTPRESRPARTSIPVVTGAVQVPPDGRPIVLLADHATVGGYPVVACVATVDLPVLGQLAPGDEIVFEVVDAATAAEADRRDLRATLARVSGWYPTSVGT